MAFDITSVLRGVSGPDTEQIEYLPLDSLLPDPNNFYSLEGIDELAGNIETIGLQQPLRVRPGEDPGTYIIVSGHRRRAAIMLIRDGGSEMFDRGVPCIIERGEASEALQKLRLIYPNIMKLDYDNRRTRASSEIQAIEEIEKKSGIELFDEFYTAQNGQPLSGEQRAFAEELLERLKEGMA